MRLCSSLPPVRRRLGAWSIGTGRPAPDRPREKIGPPRFLGNPDGPLPCSSTPAGPDAPRRDGAPGVAPAVSTAKAPAGSTLEAQSHGFGPGCLRFVVPLAGARRKTRFRPLARRYRVGLATHRVPTKGFRDSSVHLFPLPQTSPGAMTLYACHLPPIRYVEIPRITNSAATFYEEAVCAKCHLFRRMALT